MATPPTGNPGNSAPAPANTANPVVPTTKAGSGPVPPASASSKPNPTAKPDAKVRAGVQSDIKAGSAEFSVKPKGSPNPSTAGDDVGDGEAGGGDGELTPAEIKKYKLKLKVDGEEQEVEYDEDGLRKELQLSKAAQKRMQESAELRKEYLHFKSQVQSMVEAIRKDPLSALQDPLFNRGDLQEIVKKQLIEEYERSVMPEQDREKYELKKQIEERDRKLQEYEAAKEAQRAEAAKAQEEQAMREVKFDLENKFKHALELSGLPNTQEARFEIAQVYKLNLANNLDLSPEELAHETTRRLNDYTSRFVGSLDGEALVNRLGKDVVNKVVKYMIGKHRGATAAPTPPPEPVVSPTKDPEGSKKQKKLMTPEEKRAWELSLYRD